MQRPLYSLLLVSIFSAVTFSQSLPTGKWQLAEYNFAGTIEQPQRGVSATLVVKPDGKLGGNSGCNSYGGTYATNKGSLKITHIIHTLMACQKPTPEFEMNYFGMLQNATSSRVVGKKLVLKDKEGHFLRFVRAAD